jgi:predicted transcriptional regulator
MKNRDRTEILATMLEAVNGKATKTKIMYSTFLSCNQLQDYLTILIENNLIENLEGTQIYKITEKRIKFS